MPITQIPAVRSSKPMAAELSSTLVYNVYTTVLDVTNGSGIFSHIITTNSSGTGFNVAGFRITVDGIESVVVPFGNLTNNQPDDHQMFFNVRFNRSLKIEVRNVSFTTYDVAVGVCYSLEV